MANPEILYTKQDNVAVVAYNRPDAMNASTYQLRTEMMEAFEKAENDPDIQVVVLTGEGRAFSAGSDLVEPFTLYHPTVEQHLHKDHKPLINFIRQSKKTYIAALNGATAGVSVGYALTCDMVVMAESAFIYSPFAAISLIPDGGVTWHLVRYLGRARAYEMIVKNGRLKSEEAKAAGLVNDVFPDEGFRDAAVQWAKSFADNVAPLSLRYTKEALWAAVESDLDTAFNKEASLQNICTESEDNKEGIAAFLEKRKPLFKGQ